MTRLDLLLSRSLKMVHGIVACANISKLIPRPGQGDMLRTWVYYEAKHSLNQKKCLSSVLFSLKTAF